MRKKTIFPQIKSACFLAGLVCFIINFTYAAPVDTVSAKVVAANFYAQAYNIKTPSLSLAYTEKSPAGIAEYYIYNLEPGTGFIIIAAEDAANPILGYSSEKNYSLTDIAPNFAFWMQHYKKQVESIRLHNMQATAEIQSEWNAYKNNLPVKNGKRTVGSVSPLVTATWAQAPYFNADCPGGSVAGCIATAMGQIMKYWAYPPHGLGSSSYTDNPYGTLYANFDTTHYDWAAMPLNVTRSNAPVAILMYDCGVSVDMQYSPNSSGSYMISADNPPSGISAQTAFTNYFGFYSPSVQGLYNDNYSESSWLSMLQNELNNSRPLMYAGSGDSGSHAWVCDGYNTSGDFHMNWGWGGYEDGYYNIEELNPDDYSFNSDDEALIGLQPAPALAYFVASNTIIFAGDTVNFYDNSIGYYPITSWQWSFPGAVNGSSTAQNPMAIYNTAGTYEVSETVTGSGGSNTLTLNKYITVLVNNTVNVYPTLNDGTFTVQLHDASLAGSNLQFSLYNMLGQKMYTTTLVQYITQITVFVPHGIYFFCAFNSSGKPVSTGKLVMK